MQSWTKTDDSDLLLERHSSSRSPSSNGYVYYESPIGSTNPLIVLFFTELNMRSEG